MSSNYDMRALFVGPTPAQRAKMDAEAAADRARMAVIYAEREAAIAQYGMCEHRMPKDGSCTPCSFD